MFSELPKLLDRNFAVGFLLPAALFLAGNDRVLGAFGYAGPLDSLLSGTDNPWLGATTAAVVAWLVALFLLGANRSLVRLKEGYGPWNVPRNPFTLLEKWRLRRLERKIDSLKRQREEVEDRGGRFSGRPRTELIRAWHLRVHRFPDQEDFLLPTAFGNTLRAFEVYPRVMYGAESTEIWERLLAVVPKEYRELVDAARSQVDLWVNLWAVSVALLLEWITLALLRDRPIAGWFPAALLAGALFASYWSRRLAELWGKRVKACFDVFLPDLHKKLELPTPATRKAQRDLWTRTSQAMEYHAPASLPERETPSAGEEEPEEPAGKHASPVRAAAMEAIALIAGALLRNKRPAP